LESGWSKKKYSEREDVYVWNCMVHSLRWTKFLQLLTISNRKIAYLNGVIINLTLSCVTQTLQNFFYMKWHKSALMKVSQMAHFSTRSFYSIETFNHSQFLWNKWEWVYFLGQDLKVHLGAKPCLGNLWVLHVPEFGTWPLFFGTPISCCHHTPAGNV
jgi:hypothetical protein